jgi:hypothetical protein
VIASSEPVHSSRLLMSKIREPRSMSCRFRSARTRAHGLNVPTFEVGSARRGHIRERARLQITLGAHANNHNSTHHTWHDTPHETSTHRTVWFSGRMQNYAISTH